MMAKEIGTGKVVADRPTTPLRNADTEQQERLDAAMVRIQETRLRIQGNPKCTNGCSGRGFFGIQTVAMADGRWEPTLIPCKCSKPSEYANLSDQLKQLGERMNQLAALVYQGNETLFRHTFYGALKVIRNRLVAFFKRQFAKRITIPSAAPLTNHQSPTQ